MSNTPLKLTRRIDGKKVEAELVTSIQPHHFIEAEQQWAPIRLQIIQQLLEADVDQEEWPESLHWNWGKKVLELQALGASGFGILCDGRWQGMMLTDNQMHFSRFENTKDEPVIYIEYLESSPWNWTIKCLNERGEWRGIGSVMVWVAVEQSIQEGFGGRVSLHSLPQAAKFYEKVCGMTDLGADVAKQGLHYFEMSEEQGQKLYSEGGIK